MRILDEAEGIEVVGAAGTRMRSARSSTGARPDAVVTDIRMPPTHTDEGIRLARELATSHPDVAVVVLSQHAEPAYALALFERGLGRRAYLLKQRLGEPGELVRALETVAAGGSLVDPGVIHDLLSAHEQHERPTLAALTPRGREILALIAEGASNSAIAERLVITKRAVERHINAIFQKLELEDSADVSRRVKAALLYLAATDDSPLPAPFIRTGRCGAAPRAASCVDGRNHGRTRSRRLQEGGLDDEPEPAPGPALRARSGGGGRDDAARLREPPAAHPGQDVRVLRPAPATRRLLPLRRLTRRLIMGEMRQEPAAPTTSDGAPAATEAVRAEEPGQARQGAPRARLGARGRGLADHVRLHPHPWVDRQMLDNDNWNQASKELIQDPAVRDALSVYLVNQLYDNVDVEQALAQQLPAGPPGARRARRRRAAPARDERGRRAPRSARASSSPGSTRARSRTRSSSTCSRTRRGTGSRPATARSRSTSRELVAELGLDLGVPQARRSTGSRRTRAWSPC